MAEYTYKYYFDRYYSGSIVSADIDECVKTNLTQFRDWKEQYQIPDSDMRFRVIVEMADTTENVRSYSTVDGKSKIWGEIQVIFNNAITASTFRMSFRDKKSVNNVI